MGIDLRPTTHHVGVYKYSPQVTDHLPCSQFTPLGYIYSPQITEYYPVPSLHHWVYIQPSGNRLPCPQFTPLGYIYSPQVTDYPVPSLHHWDIYTALR